MQESMEEKVARMKKEAEEKKAAAKAKIAAAQAARAGQQDAKAKFDDVAAGRAPISSPRPDGMTAQEKLAKARADIEAKKQQAQDLLNQNQATRDTAAAAANALGATKSLGTKAQAIDSERQRRLAEAQAARQAAPANQDLALQDYDKAMEEKDKEAQRRFEEEEAEREAAEKAAAEEAAKREKEAAEKAAAEEAAKREKEAAEKAASEKAAEGKKAALEKAAKEKEVEDQMAKQTAAAEAAAKATAEKAAAEQKAAQEKKNQEERAAAEMAAADKAAVAKAAAEQRAAEENAAAEKAAAEQIEKATAQQIVGESNAQPVMSQPLLSPVPIRNAAPFTFPVDSRVAAQSPWQPKAADGSSGLPNDVLRSTRAAKSGKGGEVAVGAQVLVSYNDAQYAGVVCYLGTTEFANGELVGVELEEPAGKNDGSVLGRRYFECSPNHGLFIRPRAIISVAPTSAKPRTKGKKAMKSGGKSPRALEVLQGYDITQKFSQCGVPISRTAPGMLSPRLASEVPPSEEIIIDEDGKAVRVARLQRTAPEMLGSTPASSIPFSNEIVIDENGYAVRVASKRAPSPPKAASGLSPPPSPFRTVVGMPQSPINVVNDSHVAAAAAKSHPFWNALGTVSSDTIARAHKWCDDNGAQSIDDVFKYGLAGEFIQILQLKPVQELKAAEFFRRQNVNAQVGTFQNLNIERSNLPMQTGSSNRFDFTNTVDLVEAGLGASWGTNVSSSSGPRSNLSTVGAVRNLEEEDPDAELYNAIERMLKNTDRAIRSDLQNSGSEPAELFQNAFGLMHRCFTDLKDIIANVVRARVWTRKDLWRDGGPPVKDDIGSLVKDSEERLRAYIKDSEARLRAEIASMVSPSGGSLPSTSKKLWAEAKDDEDLQRHEIEGILSEPPLRPKAGGIKTYEEAFEQVGGSSALNQWSQISEQLNLVTCDPVLESQICKLLPKSRRWAEESGSTKVVQQHFAMGYDDLLCESQRISASFMEKVRKLAATSGGEASVYPPTPADCAKLKAKWAHGDCNGESAAWHRLTDVTSAVIAYPDLARMYRGLESTVCSFKGRVHDLKDQYLRPTNSNFRELLLVVEYSGHMCQLHLNTVAMLDAERFQGPRADEVQADIERAVGEGNLAGCLALLRWGTQLGTAVSTFKYFRALHTAAERGHAEIICALLRSRANANGRDAKGNTPLHLAARRGHDRAVWALIDQGGASSVLQLNADGETPLLVAARLVRQQPESASAANALCTLAHASGAEHVHEVVLRLEQKIGR